MTRPRPVDQARAIVESAVPDVKVEAISRTLTERLLTSFEVKLADGRTLLLTISPPSSRLLRSEKWLVHSEAALVEWLAKYADKNTIYPDDKRTETYTQRESSRKGWTQHSTSEALSLRHDRLIDCLPTLVKHSSNSIQPSSTFNLFQPASGDILSGIAEPLDQTSIDFQKGWLVRRIASITSPNGRFGLPVTVLGRPQNPGITQKATREHELDLDGAESWRKTFHLLLEGILRDGEDLAVTMSYELVRATYHKFSPLLDAVKTPRLVVYDADGDDNVLVSRVRRTSKHRDETKNGITKLADELDCSAVDALDISRENTDGNQTTKIQITGLRDWSNSIFGDPLFATIFSHATPDFKRGFHHPHAEDPTTTTKKEERTNPDDPDIIEDPANAQTRILLYECYHATASIVRQFYRPDAESSRREIAARRRLMAALAKLEAVAAAQAQGAGKRPRRGSREVPAKRARSDTPVGRRWVE
ncbi:hypothetical protein F4861DRAFT_101782 [Xylaria intraflava]|nr:hypothetical protein F4861DRAFT_101782 [Xylaria intraflava]